mmetsp:Transcript_43136/g.101329  ORF Transcript_43136/g.101329 Transcript_43136/m.101329 type:complete len:614 (+) Transcript_43136:82-1923(+)
MLDAEVPSPPGGAGNDQLSPKGGKVRTRPRKKTRGTMRVTWDEKIIAEHDKERGTRQKIDEPDTPYIRSPQTASDSEGGVVSSDEEHAQHRLSWRRDDAVYGGSCSSKAVPVPNPAEISAAGELGTSGAGNGAGMADEWHEDVANRLNDWVKGGHRRTSTDSCSAGSSDGCAAADEPDFSRTSSANSSRSSSSAPQWRGLMGPLSSTDSVNDGKKHDRRISLPEETPQPKPSSDKFKAKRAQHYNEVAALKAFKQKFGTGFSGDDSSPESDTSDEDKKESCGDVQTKTNTNTNLNQTLSKAMEQRGLRKAHSGELATTPTGSDKAGHKKKKRLAAHQLPTEEGDADHPMGDLPENGSHVSISPSQEGPQGRDSRQPPGHDQPMESAQSAAQSSRRSSVSFSGESGGESSEEFRSLRNRHYAAEWRQDRSIAEQVSSLETNTNTNLNAGSGCPQDKRGQRNPMEAGRPPVHFGDSSEGAEPQSSDEFRARRQQHYNEVDTVRRFRQDGVQQEELGESSSSEEQRLESAVEGGAARPAASSNPANPMEPRDSGVAFCENTPSPEVVSTGPDRSRSRSAAEEAAWRDKRAAHYNDMAAAFRNMPPPSDSDEESDDD